jgi:hypothetical protein
MYSYVGGQLVPDPYGIYNADGTLGSNPNSGASYGAATVATDPGLLQQLLNAPVINTIANNLTQNPAVPITQSAVAANAGTQQTVLIVIGLVAAVFILHHAK